MKSKETPDYIILEKGDKGYRIKVFGRKSMGAFERFYSDEDVKTFREEALKNLLEMCDNNQKDNNG